MLGSTLFREQIVSAATTPFQNVVVQNTNTNPVPVQQVGTSTTSVTGTVGIDSSKNTVNLDSIDAARLASIENALGNLKFDGSGNLATSAQVGAPSPVAQECFSSFWNSSYWSVDDDFVDHTICSGDFYVTDITAGGMDDAVTVQFEYQGNVVLSLDGSGGRSGNSSYQIDLTHPIHVDKVVTECSNASTHCDFTLAVLGNSTGT